VARVIGVWVGCIQYASRGGADWFVIQVSAGFFAAGAALMETLQPADASSKRRTDNPSPFRPSLTQRAVS